MIDRRTMQKFLPATFALFLVATAANGARASVLDELRQAHQYWMSAVVPEWGNRSERVTGALGPFARSWFELGRTIASHVGIAIPGGADLRGPLPLWRPPTSMSAEEIGNKMNRFISDENIRRILQGRSRFFDELSGRAIGMRDWGILPRKEQLAYWMASVIVANPTWADPHWQHRVHAEFCLLLIFCPRQQRLSPQP